MKCLIYVTKSKWHMFFDKIKNIFSLSNKKIDNDLNGKIVAEFDGEVEEIHNEYDNSLFYTDKCGGFRLQFRSCLDCKQFATYLNGKTGYAIHIKNLEIFEKPKRLYDYLKSYSVTFDCFGHLRCEGLKRAPQNMCYAYDEYGNKYVVISVHPEWACKILNGEKTIEVRKKVLNCMKGE